MSQRCHCQRCNITIRTSTVLVFAVTALCTLVSNRCRIPPVYLVFYFPGFFKDISLELRFFQDFSRILQDVQILCYYLKFNDNFLAFVSLQHRLRRFKVYYLTLLFWFINTKNIYISFLLCMWIRFFQLQQLAQSRLLYQSLTQTG